LGVLTVPAKFSVALSCHKLRSYKEISQPYLSKTPAQLCLQQITFS